MTLGTSQEVNAFFCIGIDEISANYEGYQKDDMVHIDFPIIFFDVRNNVHIFVAKGDIL